MRFLRGSRSNRGVDREVGLGRGLLHLECILMDIAARELRDALAAAAHALGRVHGIAPDALCERLCNREARRSSALGDGIALPHADMWGTTRPRAAYVRLAAPLQFGEGRTKREVQDLLVLVAPRPATAIHHAMLQHYRRLLEDADFLRRLRACPDAAEVWWLLREHEWSPEAPRGRAVKRRDTSPLADATLTQRPASQG